MSTLPYAREQYAAAVHTLATGRDLKGRLMRAYCYNVIFAPTQDLPPQIAKAHEWICATLDGRSGEAGGAIKLMRYKTAERVAERICDVSSELQSLQED
ncbi:MAG TPA: hypothetical protein VFJ82_12960 [Longimicrobium sp.]|nr:hypothetical protein [Longimicrobium sp.]